MYLSRAWNPERRVPDGAFRYGSKGQAFEDGMVFIRLREADRKRRVSTVVEREVPDKILIIFKH